MFWIFLDIISPKKVKSTKIPPYFDIPYLNWQSFLIFQKILILTNPSKFDNPFLYWQPLVTLTIPSINVKLFDKPFLLWQTLLTLTNPSYIDNPFISFQVYLKNLNLQFIESEIVLGTLEKFKEKCLTTSVCWELKCALKGQLLIKDGHLLRTTVKFRGHYVYHQPTSLLIAGGKKGTLVICFFKSWLDFHNWFGASSPNALFFTKVKKMQQKQICRDFEVSCNIFLFYFHQNHFWNWEIP